MDDWKSLSTVGSYQGNVEYRKDWSPRNSHIDMTLMIFSETAEYFQLGDNLDVAIAIIDNATYIVVDWEEVESAEETEKSIAFRIKN
tara:strand:+ start:381 stop:641 length:261 start_codon:yes stop_codon:yes gene_type:complete